MQRKIMAKSKKGQRGMALPMALIMMALASLIVVPFLQLVQTQLSINTQVSQKTQAYYAADAGVAYLIWKYTQRTPPTISYTLPGINGMDVTVSPVAGTTAAWVASAQQGSGKAQVFVQVQQVSQGNNVFPYAVASLQGAITMNEQSTVTSDDAAISGGDIFASALEPVGGDEHHHTNTIGDVHISDRTDHHGNTGVSVYGNAKYTGEITGADSINEQPPVKSATQIDIHKDVIDVAIAKNKVDAKVAQSFDKVDVPGATTHYASDNPYNPGDGTQNLGSIIVEGGSYEHNHHVYYYPADMEITPGTNDTTNITMGKAWIGNNLEIYGDLTNNSQPVYVGNDMTIGNQNHHGHHHSRTDPSQKVTLGDTYVVGDLEIRDQSEVTLDSVYVGGNLSIHDDAKVTLGPTYVAGDMELDLYDDNDDDVFEIQLTGPVYVGGDLTIKDHTSLRGGYTVVAEGSATLNGRSETEFTNKQDVPFIIARNGDVHISSNAWVSAVIYAPNGSAHLSGNVIVFGAIVAESVTMDDNSSVEYMTGLRNMDWPPGWGLIPGEGGGTGVKPLISYDYR